VLAKLTPSYAVDKTADGVIEEPLWQHVEWPVNIKTRFDYSHHVVILGAGLAMLAA
jgi:hypothetical protein